MSNTKKAPKTVEGVKEETVAGQTALKLTKETADALREQIKKDKLAELGISEEQSKDFLKLCEEALMPITMTDKEFKLGQGELDIRNLSENNKYQMFFRTLVIQNVWIKQLSNSLLDITRLLMVVIDKLGIEDISAATDEVIEKAQEQHNSKLRQQMATETKDKDKLN